MTERNISAFNDDAAGHDGYIYTRVERWSSQIAGARHTDEIIALLERNFTSSVSIVDLGCGDGTFTTELARRFHPRHVRGIEPATLAVESAQRRVSEELRQALSFEVGNIYDVTAKSGETVAILRGVLHHLDDVRKAVAHLATQFQAVIVLEPNGYSPALKIIERLSAYHRAHDEKSYWPPNLNRWFEECGFSVSSQKFFGLVPYFCPTPIAKTLKAVEPVFEMLPVLKQVGCGTNLIFYQRQAQ